MPTKRCERVTEDLFVRGWSIEPDFLGRGETEALAAEIRLGLAAGEFRPAGIGAGEGFQVDHAVRRDRLRWLDQAAPTPAQRDYLGRLELLRRSLNQAMQLGLFSFEGHFSVYGAGGYYHKHLDQLRGGDRRRVSVVLYLNADWKPSDDGRLRLYLDGAGRGECRDVEPRGGTLVAFLSDRFYHEVLPARRERLTLGGWFLARE